MKKELGELAEFLCALGTAIDKSTKDGFTWSDSLNFTQAIVLAPSAFIGISNVDEEYFDLTDTEKAELKALISAKLALSNEQVSTIVESVVNVALELNGVLKAILVAKAA